jgi:hypothetical protein
MDAHPMADHFNNLPGDFADDMPKPEMSMPDGWGSEPNWGSDASVYAQMRGPDNPPKAVIKKQKKQAHNDECQADSWIAIREKGTREYLAQSMSHTVADKALKRDIHMVMRAFALREAEQAKTVVIPTPQFVDLMVCPR